MGRETEMLSRRTLLKGLGVTMCLPLLEAMQLDKKARAGAVRFALPRAIGAMHGDAEQGWTVAAPEAIVRATLAATI